jgi:hypothetical protein
VRALSGEGQTMKKALLLLAAISFIVSFAWWAAFYIPFADKMKVEFPPLEMLVRALPCLVFTTEECSAWSDVARGAGFTVAFRPIFTWVTIICLVVAYLIHVRERTPIKER